MRTALTAISGFTILASAWLFTMYLVLRHPGFEWRAPLSLGFIAIGLVTIGFSRSRAPGASLRTAAAAGALCLAAAGAWAIATNVDDGFVNLIGIAFIVQGILTLCAVWLLRGPVRLTAAGGRR